MYITPIIIKKKIMPTLKCIIKGLKHFQNVLIQLFYLQHYKDNVSSWQ